MTKTTPQDETTRNTIALKELDQKPTHNTLCNSFAPCVKV